jgi:hypothetical protein
LTQKEPWKLIDFSLVETAFLLGGLMHGKLKLRLSYELFQRGRRLVWFRTLAFQANDPGFKSRRPHQCLLSPNQRHFPKLNQAKKFLGNLSDDEIKKISRLRI